MTGPLPCSAPGGGSPSNYSSRAASTESVGIPRHRELLRREVDGPNPQVDRPRDRMLVARAFHPGRHPRDEVGTAVRIALPVAGHLGITPAVPGLWRRAEIRPGNAIQQADSAGGRIVGREPEEI